MHILGIHDGHDCGAALLKDSQIIAAVNEERINRKKLCWGFPHLSIKEVLALGKTTPAEIGLIAVATKNAAFIPEPLPFEKSPFAYQDKENFFSKSSSVLGGFYKSRAWIALQRAVESSSGKKRQKKIRQLLPKIGFSAPVVFVDHHLAHAASAFFTSGKKTSLVITSDGSGDALSSIVAVAEKGEIKKLAETGSYNSLGKFYEHVTYLCGFKPNKHEGKITGLAAFGKPSYLKEFEKMVGFRKGNIYNQSRSRHASTIKLMRKLIPNFSKEDLSASVQEHTESVMTKFAGHWLEKTGLKDISLAGGLFANVKLNQRILALHGVESVFIHPHMGDGGLAVGAALFALAEKKLDSGSCLKPIELNDVYFGRGFSNEEIQTGFEKAGLKGKFFENAEEKIAELAASGKTIGRFNGRMEYGPRALGNRTIIASPADKKINDWLNKKLHRTEFMPFAPSVLESEAENFFEEFEKGSYPARFMTITFDVKKKVIEKIPAVVHVDNTARPQVVSKENNESYFKILKAYKEITGLPAFVNTSFNIHEEPIVFSPNDAIRSYKQGAVDILSMGNWIVQ